MLTPQWYEACTDQILVLYSRLEDDILKDIIRRILKTGMVTESAKWQAEMLQEAGMLYNDIMQEIAKYTSQTTEEVRLLFEEAGTEVMRNDNIILQSTTGQKLHLSDSGLQILKSNYRNTLGNLRNLTNTTAITSQAAFIAACNDAHMQITSGASSYSEAIRNAIRRTAQGGLTVKYPTGHIDKLDVAVRRAALTGVGQAAAKISIMNAKEMDCYLMEITAHSGARPDHAKWQGQLVTLTGQDAGKTIDGMKVWTLSGIGYGTGAGFRGWNCRHDWNPYFPGSSTPNYGKKELEKLNEKKIEWNGEKHTEYEISQMQRAEERKVRALKRECIANNTAIKNASDAETKAMFQSEYQKSAAKLKTAEQQLKDFCKATNQQRDKFREQVLGFSRSEAQKAVWASKKSLTSRANSGIIEEKSNKPITQITNSAIEKVRYADVYGFTNEQCNKIQLYHKELLRYSRDNNQCKEVAFVFDNALTSKKEFIGSDDSLDFGATLYGKDLFVMHNHPRNSSYSTNDIIFLLQHHEVKSLSIVKNNGNIEILSKRESFDVNAIYKDFQRIIKKTVKTESSNEYDKAINKLLEKHNQEGGMIEWIK